MERLGHKSKVHTSGISVLIKREKFVLSPPQGDTAISKPESRSLQPNWQHLDLDFPASRTWNCDRKRSPGKIRNVTSKGDATLPHHNTFSQELALCWKN